MSELTFPKAPPRATHVRLTVGKYKKAIVSMKNRDTLQGVAGVYQHGFLEGKRIFKPMDVPYFWDGNSYLDKNGKPNEADGEGKVSLQN